MMWLDLGEQGRVRTGPHWRHGFQSETFQDILNTEQELGWETLCNPSKPPDLFRAPTLCQVLGGMVVNSSGHRADQASVPKELTFWWGRQIMNK